MTAEDALYLSSSGDKQVLNSGNNNHLLQRATFLLIRVRTFVLRIGSDEACFEFEFTGSGANSRCWEFVCKNGVGCGGGWQTWTVDLCKQTGKWQAAGQTDNNCQSVLANKLAVRTSLQITFLRSAGTNAPPSPDQTHDCQPLERSMLPLGLLLSALSVLES